MTEFCCFCQIIKGLPPNAATDGDMETLNVRIVRRFKVIELSGFIVIEVVANWEFGKMEDLFIKE